ncbi:hypothetical protein [Candidatus Clostridium radicumherbarum]|uniref:hypothetical protein n=1 Tax=Candidatus Clostridium radicumherbarum TaxID=3381662 RepID=UPI0038779AF4
MHPPPNYIPDIYRARALGMCRPPKSNNIMPITFTPCFFKITYIWLKDYTGLWVKPINLSEDFWICWVWNLNLWILAKVPIINIEAFICN